jgi:putative colanic acid biosynthesis UDP-glucose lipid carrier transferase
MEGLSAANPRNHAFHDARVIAEAPVHPLESITESLAAAIERRARDTAPAQCRAARNIAFDVATREPTLATMLLELLNPSLVVLTLLACVMLEDGRVAAHMLVPGVLAFLLAQRLLVSRSARWRSGRAWSVRLPWYRLILGWCVTFAVMWVLRPYLLPAGVLSRAVLPLWFIATPVMLVVCDRFGELVLRHWLIKRGTRQRHVVVGATDVGVELERRLAGTVVSGQFMGYFDYREPERLPPAARGHWAGRCSELAQFVKRHRVDAIYITLPIVPRLSELLSELRDTTASVFLVPNLLAMDLVRPTCSTVHGIPVLSVCDTPLQGTSALSKRVMDVTVSALLLLLGAPLLLAIAVGVKCSSPGPVLFRQRRYGLNGEEIFIYKFRTMTVCEDDAFIRQATINDRRVTRFGRALRRSSLDELPQLWNILQGKMSLVGPRPHAVIHNEQYRKLINGYMIRHKVRPGITGWAQVNGLRGETDTVEKMRRRIEYDIEYLDHWSLRLDLKILLRTALLVIRDSCAY